MELGVAGKGYIIVGGSRGMGFETAKLLAADGGNIAIISRGESCKDAAAQIASQFGVKAFGIQGDAMKAGEIEQAVDRAAEALGGVAGLLAASADRKYGGLMDTTDEDWTNCFESVVMGPVRSCRAAMPYMMDAGGGSIVTMGAYSARSSKSYTIAYSSAKAMLVNITKNIARTFGEFGIRANCIAPGVIETERTRARVESIIEERKVPRDEAERIDLANFNMGVALNRVAQPIEVARLIAFLLSDMSSYTSGAFVNVDGGTDF